VQGPPARRARDRQHHPHLSTSCVGDVTHEERIMAFQDDEDTRSYQVVLNHEEQYSIWLADRDVPAGWKPAGKVGSKAQCLEYIKGVGVDMRPLSLRNKMTARD